MLSCFISNSLPRVQIIESYSNGMMAFLMATVKSLNKWPMANIMTNLIDGITTVQRRNVFQGSMLILIHTRNPRNNARANGKIV